MKKIILFLLLAVPCLTAGCSGFLEEDNRSNINSQDYYKTAAGFNTLLNSAYSSLRDLYGNKPTILLAGTDLYLDGRARGHFDSPLGMYKSLEPTNGDVLTFYKTCFDAIGRANAVLHYSKTTEQTTDLPRQVAEARFLRAFFYFHLVQQFGDIALVKEMTDKILLEFPRDPELTVYAFIISEMEAVKNDLIVKSSGDNYGRIDQRTANHFLSKVYLTRGWITNDADDYKKATEYGIAAIGNDKLDLTFEQAYKASAYQYRNKEVIWSVIYSPQSMETTTSGNSQASHFGGYLDGSPAGNKSTDGSLPITLYGHYLFTKDIDDPNHDSRYDLTFMKYVYDKSLCFYSKSPAELAATKITAYYPTWWNKDYGHVDTWKAENPAQRTGTKVREIASPGNPDTDLETFQRISSEFTSNSNTNYYYPTFRKFDCPEVTVFSNNGSFRDVDIARLNDTYLTVAEAFIQWGKPDQAVPYINEVRKRSIDASDPKREISTAQATIDFVLDERARELMGHYDRWYDLKRTGKLIERALKYNPEIEGNASWFVGQDGKQKLLRPIPQDAIDVNKSVIKQNPGYM